MDAPMDAHDSGFEAGADSASPDADGSTWRPWDGGPEDSSAGDSAEMDSGPVCSARDGGCLPGIETFEMEPFPEFGIVSTPYMYHSGLVLSMPVPNDFGQSPVTMVRCGASGFFGFRCSEGARFIPSGTTFIASAEIGLHYDYVEFTLPANASLVRFHVAATSDLSSPPPSRRSA